MFMNIRICVSTIFGLVNLELLDQTSIMCLREVIDDYDTDAVFLVISSMSLVNCFFL